MEILNYTYDKRRFENFIDAIIAIILTILVLELRLPESEETNALNTQQQVASLLHSFVSYIGSFLLIVGIWIDHHVLFLNLQKLTKSYILLNMLFILSLSLVPFTTAFAGSHSDDSFAVALLLDNLCARLTTHWMFRFMWTVVFGLALTNIIWLYWR